MFKLWTLTSIIGIALILGIGPGCGKERSRAVSPEEAAAGGEERDYSDVLRRVREKHADTQKLDRLRTSIETFQIDLGRPPSNIVEMVKVGYLKEIPEAPAGMMYHYDPTNGVMRTLKIPNYTGGIQPAPEAQVDMPH